MHKSILQEPKRVLNGKKMFVQMLFLPTCLNYVLRAKNAQEAGQNNTPSRPTQPNAVNNGRVRAFHCFDHNISF